MTFEYQKLKKIDAIFHLTHDRRNLSFKTFKTYIQNTIMYNLFEILPLITNYTEMSL